jgi:hypothetical protein
MYLVRRLRTALTVFKGTIRFTCALHVMRHTRRENRMSPNSWALYLAHDRERMRLRMQAVGAQERVVALIR